MDDLISSKASQNFLQGRFNARSALMEGNSSFYTGGLSEVVSLSEVVDCITEPFLIHDGQFIELANIAAVNFFQAGCESELHGCSIWDVILPDYAEMMQKHLERVSHGEKAEVVNVKMKVNGGREDVEVEINSAPCASEKAKNGKLLMRSVISDLSKRRHKEEQLMELDKLDLLRSIAGGVAHDFNNFLAILQGNISMCRKVIDSPQKILSKMDNMEKSVMQAKELTCQLLSYAREGLPSEEVVSIGQLMQDITRFTLSGTSATSEIKLGNNLPQVKANRSQMAQIINNLLINAVQAMPDGGKIEIEVDKVEKGEFIEEVSSFADKVYLKFSVIDEGKGISLDIKDKIFEPFFTTRESGTGLGLSIVSSVVEKYEGFMQVSSQPERGSKFSIFLPATQKEIISPDMPCGEIRAGEGKILVMEDTKEIREITCKMLEMLGYEADFACEGQEALELYLYARKGNHSYDAVIMDMEVPGGLNGKGAIKELLQMDPEARVIVTSGHTFHCNEKNDGVLNKVKAFIEKPFRMEELSMVLQQALHDD